jgi:6-phosphogluconolactonase (cycloisomerase 2 family)
VWVWVVGAVVWVAVGLCGASSALAATPAVTPVPGSPFATGSFPGSPTFSPSGGLLAVRNGEGGTVTVFSVNSATGVLKPVPGSPFATGPGALAFSPLGDLLAVAGNGQLSVFSVKLRDGDADTGAGLAVCHRRGDADSERPVGYQSGAGVGGLQPV